MKLFDEIENKITKDFDEYCTVKNYSMYADAVRGILFYLLDSNQEQKLKEVLNKNVFPSLCEYLEEDDEIFNLILSKTISWLEAELEVKFDD